MSVPSHLTDWPDTLRTIFHVRSGVVSQSGERTKAMWSARLRSALRQESPGGFKNRLLSCLLFGHVRARCLPAGQLVTVSTWTAVTCTNVFVLGEIVWLKSPYFT